ncbi:MAG: response regulator transcription factor [bacterium]|nr:response regulator transcription factor [bacterium]
MGEEPQIFIADNSPLVCEQLMTLLSEVEDIELVGDAQDVPTAMLSIQRLHPDVVILDIRMSGGNGFDLLSFIKRNHLTTKVIVLTNAPYPQYKKRCLDLGANYFFDKSTEFEKIITVLE